MSFVYVCHTCGRIFSADDYTKSGVWNKMFKTVDLVGGATPGAGLYSAAPTMRCPYCYSRDTALGNEGQRVLGMFRRRSYPPVDVFRYVWLMTAQKFEDCYVNVDAAERTVSGLSEDARARLLPELERIGWRIDRAFLGELPHVFTKPVLGYCVEKATFSAFETSGIVFALNVTGADEYEISGDGENWLNYEQARQNQGAELLNRANCIIGDYSLMIRY